MQVTAEHEAISQPISQLATVRKTQEEHCEQPTPHLQVPSTYSRNSNLPPVGRLTGGSRTGLPYPGRARQTYGARRLWHLQQCACAMHVAFTGSWAWPPNFLAQCLWPRRASWGKMDSRQPETPCSILDTGGAHTVPHRSSWPRLTSHSRNTRFNGAKHFGLRSSRACGSQASA